MVWHASWPIHPGFDRSNVGCEILGHHRLPPQIAPRRIMAKPLRLHVLQTLQIVLHMTLYVQYWGILPRLLGCLLVSDGGLLRMLSPLKTGSVKRRLRYALSFLLIDVITWRLRDNSLVIHYL